MWQELDLATSSVLGLTAPLWTAMLGVLTEKVREGGLTNTSMLRVGSRRVEGEGETRRV